MTPGTLGPVIRRSLRSSWFLVPLLAVVVASCSDTVTIDRTRLQEFVSIELSEQLGYEITDVECPRIVDPELDETFECLGVVDGQTVRFDGRVTDPDEGEVWIENADAILPIDVLESVIEDDYATRDGLDLEVDCGDGQVIVEPAGAVFRCDVAESSTGETTTIRIEVSDREGNVVWELE